MIGTYLGGIDARFFGVKIVYSSFDDFDFSRKVYSKEVTPAELVALRTSDPCFERKLWLSTVIEHEVRHYHDSLISTHWYQTQALRNQTAINCQSMLSSMALVASLSESNCLAVPLSRWLRLSAAERELFRSAWDQAEPEDPWSIVPLPIFPLPSSPPSEFWPAPKEELRGEAEHLAGTLFASLIAQGRFSELDTGRVPAELGIRPVHVYEISAIIAQIAAAYITIDDRAANELRLSILSNGWTDYGKPFSSVFTWLMQCNGIGIHNVIMVMSYITTWALLGPPDLKRSRRDKLRSEWDIQMSRPASRLMFAVSVFRNFKIDTDNPNKLFRILEVNSKTASMRSSMDWMDEILSKKSLEYKRLADESGRKDVITISNHFEIYLRQRNKMMEIIKRDPSAYASPSQYSSKISDFPTPLVRLDFEGQEPIMRYEDDPAKAAGSGIYEWEMGPEGMYVVRSYIVHQPDDIDLQVISDYESLQVHTDALINGKVPQRDFLTLSRLFKRRGLNIFRV